MSTRSLQFAIALIVSTGFGWSQVAEPAAPETPAASAVTVQGAEPSGAGMSRHQDTLSVDFPDEDIRTILRNVADLFELNLVVPDTLQGKTSIKLRDVTWRQIFDVVLTPVGYTFIEEGSIIKVVSRESLLQEPVSTEVFILNYARASEVLPIVSSLVDAAAGGKIVVDGRSNALVITERPSQMGKIRPIIEQLDKATAQVMIESKFIEVTDRDVKNIGVNWSSLGGFRVGVGGISQTFERSRDQAFSSGTSTTGGTSSSDSSNTAKTNNSGAGTSTSSTTTNPQGSGSTTTTRTTNNFPSGTQTTRTVTTNNTTGLVTSDVTTATTATSRPDIGSTTTTTLSPVITGILGSTGSTNTTNNVSGNIASSASSALNSLLDLTNGGGTSRIASAVFSSSDFDLILSALKTQDDVKIVSNPTVVTLNNTEAIINVGEEYPVPNYTYNQEKGAFEVSGFDYKPIGILLKVTPQVNARGFIKLTLEPEVSQRSGQVTFGGGQSATAQIPIIATRKAKTQVSMQDGYTMGIGGLIRTQSIKGNTRVPVLGEFPLIGRLFRSDSTDTESTNLIIFITAKSINAEGAGVEDIFDPRQIRGLHMQRNDLPGYRDGSDPFLPAEPAAEPGMGK